MNRFRFYLFYILFSIGCCGFAQTQIENITADFIKIDLYGNIYAIKESTLTKYSQQGKLLFTYSNKTMGAISSIDVFNPMKIMLFYKDAGTILFLNEQLALINEPISLFDANYYTVSLASYSAGNQIHLYDNANQYLITLDFNMREISKTPVNFPNFQPVKMIELEEKSIAFHDPNSGIYLFDAFGTYNKLIPVITNHCVEVTSEWIYYTQADSLFFYNYKLLDSNTQPLPVSNAVQTLIYRNNMIFLLQNGTVWIYN